jgi:hypothetical protein
MEEVSIMEQSTPHYDENPLNSLRAHIMAWARQGRDSRLSATDYIFLPDVTVAQEHKDSLIQYRAVLRDFPAEFSALLSAMSEEELCSVTPQSIIYPENSQ